MELHNYMVLQPKTPQFQFILVCNNVYTNTSLIFIHYLKKLVHEITDFTHEFETVHVYMQSIPLNVEPAVN